MLCIGDGDTLRVLAGGRRVTIRLACIDAPEMAQSPLVSQSRSLLAGLASVGSDVNLQMVRGGQAFAYGQYLRQCNAAAYLGAERGAEFVRQSVWSVPGGIERPWEFRLGRRGYRHVAATAEVPQPRPAPPCVHQYRCEEIGPHAQDQDLKHLGHTDPDCFWDGKANQERACCKELIQPRGKSQLVIAFTLGTLSQAPPCQSFPTTMMVQLLQKRDRRPAADAQSAHHLDQGGELPREARPTDAGPHT